MFTYFQNKCFHCASQNHMKNPYFCTNFVATVKGNNDNGYHTDQWRLLSLCVTEPHGNHFSVLTSFVSQKTECFHVKNKTQCFDYEVTESIVEPTMFFRNCTSKMRPSTVIMMSQNRV